MPVAALVLFAISTTLTLPFVLSRRSLGPEGPVGVHMVTGPIALLQVAAIALLIADGGWDFFRHSAVVYGISLVGYFAAMTLLPIAALPPQRNRTYAQGATLVTLAAGLAAAAVAIPEDSPVALRAATGAVLALPALGGWGILVALVVQSQVNTVRRAAADAERLDTFEREQAAFDAGEWAKLPPDAELWQLIPYTHSRNENVRRECRERIAARPDLEADMIELLGTGWAEHALAYLRDAYPLPRAPLAPAYGAFLEKQVVTWSATLPHDPNAGSWELNLLPMFDVAEQVVADGGDLREPLEKWRELLASSRGLGRAESAVERLLELSRA
jgi:hypothetical protein